jgi:uncharacterized surface protein with fasciclin (FAS1) repeats
MSRTGLDTTLNGTGPFTVFVPTDTAFGTVGVTGASLANFPPDSLRRWLLYHTIAGTQLITSSFPSGPNSKIIMANGDSIFVSNGQGGFFVNGIPVESADIIASNGVIQAITQQPLLPARGSLMELIQQDTSYSYLVAAVLRASQGTTDVQTLLSKAAPYSLLAPINSAFRTGGYNTVTDINNAVPDTLANLILYHIIPARLFTSDISGGQSFVTVAGPPITFTSTGSQRQVKGITNDINADLLKVNQMAHNGVLYTINQLLTH